MKNICSLIVLNVLLSGMVACQREDSTSPYEFKTKPIQDLDEQLRQDFLRPNRWGYSIVFFPTMSRHGYTYCFNLVINLKGIKLESISEIETLHAVIYGETLSKLNWIKSIRPFLANFPLTPESFSFSIGFDDEKGNQLPSPYFVSMIMSRENMEFSIANNASVMFPFETVLKKPTADSLPLQKFYHCLVPRKQCIEKPHVPDVSYILSNCCPFQHAVFEFTKTISKKNNLNFVDIWPAEKEHNDPTPFNMIFWSSERISLEAARKLAAECSNEFLKFVQNDKRTLDRMEERSKDLYSHDEAVFPEPRHIGFRISFWDENIDRQAEPYIAEIRLYDGKFKYFTADEGQRLVLVHEETFDEAQAFLNAQKGVSSQ